MTGLDNQGITVTRDAHVKGVSVITIDRPPVNAMTLAAYRQLTEVFRTECEWSDLRCIVLTGTGQKAFVGGSDVAEFKELTAATAVTRSRHIRECYNTIRQSTVPVVAAVNGAAMGGGMVIVASCDIVVAASGAKFGIPEINVGILGGTKHLSRLVPTATVRWMAMTGRSMAAEDFAAIGAIHQVVEPDQVFTRACEIAGELASKSPAAMRAQKEALNLTEYMGLEEGYETEQHFSGLLADHPHSKEAARAFFEKRAPVYS